MKHLQEPELEGAVILKPAGMNKIHFGGNHTPLTPRKLKTMADSTMANATQNDGTPTPKASKNM